MNKEIDLHSIIRWGEHPIRLGLINDEVFYCLNDLMLAVGVNNVNVTYAMVKIPPDFYLRASTIDHEYIPSPSKVVAVNFEGAMLALSRLSKIDLFNAVKLIKWLLTVDKEKLKKGA